MISGVTHAPDTTIAIPLFGDAGTLAAPPERKRGRIAATDLAGETSQRRIESGAGARENGRLAAAPTRRSSPVDEERLVGTASRPNGAAAAVYGTT